MIGTFRLRVSKPRGRTFGTRILIQILHIHWLTHITHPSGSIVVMAFSGARTAIAGPRLGLFVSAEIHQIGSIFYFDNEIQRELGLLNDDFSFVAISSSSFSALVSTTTLALTSLISC